MSTGDAAMIAMARKLLDESFSISVDTVLAGIREALAKKQLAFICACLASAYQIGKNLEPLYKQLPWVPDAFKMAQGRVRQGGVGAGDTITHNVNGGGMRLGGFMLLAASTHPKARDFMSSKGNPLTGMIAGSERAKPILMEFQSEYQAAFKAVANAEGLKDAADAGMSAMYPRTA
jgi:hypothetical protein